jgi:choline kinase
VLAAGRGSRLRPLTDDRPKCLLEVGGEPIIARIVRILAEQDLTSFTIVDGFAGDRLRAALRARFPAAWFHFVRNEAWADTNNAWSLRLARASASEPLLLLDSDLVFEGEVLERLLADPRPNRLALRRGGGFDGEEMKVSLGPDGRVGDLGKGLPAGAVAGESLGLEVFAADAADQLFAVLDRRLRAAGGRDEFYEAAFVELIASGTAVWPVDMGRLRCLEVDTPEDLAEARRLFAPT